MSAGNRYYERRPLTTGEFFVRLLGVLALVVLVAGAGLYFAGWLDIRGNENTATIEIKTNEIKEAAEETVESGRELVNEATATSSSQSDPPAEDRDSTKLR